VKFFQGGGSPKDRERYIERIRPDNWREWLDWLKLNIIVSPRAKRW
jgi:hypothetical protein